MHILKNGITRRRFLKSSAAASTLLVLPNWVIGQSKSPNEKINVAVIGVGGRGGAAVRAASGSENIVAFCDVDEKRAGKEFADHPDIPRFQDYRVMFDKLGDEIDAVTISTPDHLHYAIALWAIATASTSSVKNRWFERSRKRAG